MSPKSGPSPKISLPERLTTPKCNAEASPKRKSPLEFVVDTGKELMEQAHERVIETSYLDDDNLKAITDHKFLSGEYTFLDQVFYRYWWIPCLKFVPSWLAPNCLTVLGFFLSIGAFALIYWDAPTLTEELTPVNCIIAALCIFLYQTLDALDGLHARKYGYGSPLGQLMDHGCDAFTTGFFSHIQLAILRIGIGNGLGFTVLFFFQSSLFIYSWWEKTFHEYRTNSANKGVTEGQVLLIIQLFAIAYWGHDIWNRPLTEVPAHVLPQRILDRVVGWSGIIQDITPLHVFLSQSSARNVWHYVTNMRLNRIILAVNIYLQGEMILYDMFYSIYNCVTQQKKMALLEYLTFLIHVATCWSIFYSSLPQVVPLVPCLTGSLCGGILTIRLILSTVGKRHFSILQWPQFPVLLGCGGISCLKLIYGTDHWILHTYGGIILHAVLLFELVVAIHLVVLSVILLRRHLAVRVFHVQRKDL